MFGSRMRKLGPVAPARREDDGGGTIHDLIFSGDPMNGTSGDDFMFGYAATSAVNNEMFGNGGDDVMLGDYSNFRSSSSAANGSMATALNLDSAVSAWTDDDNPLIYDPLGPAAHVTVYVEGTAGDDEWFSVTVGGDGSTHYLLSVDVDYGAPQFGSGEIGTNTVIEIYSSSGALLAFNDVAETDFGGLGSLSFDDPYSVLQVFGGQTFFVRIRETDADTPNFEGGETFLLHILVGAHDKVGNTFGGIDELRGGEGNDELFGGGGNDFLAGDGGGDRLHGGPGADRMEGGLGDDIFYVDNIGDTIVEEVVSGFSFDQVIVSINDYVLTAGAAVEALDTPADFFGGNLTGNEFSQLLRGNGGDNILRGEGGNDTLYGYENEDTLDGGAGADEMYGGTDDDTYFVDNASDMVFELVNGGDDSVYAGISFALAASAWVETLATTNQAGTGAIALWGSNSANSVFGNEGNNQLLGFGGTDQLTGYGGNDVLVGGAGIDYMRGGLGNDVYGIDENDVILEVAGEGDDSLAANVGSYFLNDDASIETLSTANQAGTIAQNLTGNNFAQSIAGSEGANVLNGRLGNDLLRGYGGADIFLFDTAAGASNHDVIADMQLGIDKIALQNAVFAGLQEGNLGANAFRIGTSAQDADDRVIWNAATNQLFYDADGTGAGAAILFAIVNGSPNLQASDFMVV